MTDLPVIPASTPTTKLAIGGGILLSVGLIVVALALGLNGNDPQLPAVDQSTAPAAVNPTSSVSRSAAPRPSSKAPTTTAVTTPPTSAAAPTTPAVPTAAVTPPELTLTPAGQPTPTG